MSSGQNAASIGIMDPAFFVPKGQLLQWVNSKLKLNLAKVEECANGAVYTQLIDCMCWSSPIYNEAGRRKENVAMKKINWSARDNSPEALNNYKVLQQAFDKCNIQKVCSKVKILFIFSAH
jgi:microtubule-associated protein, RP/EB family